MKINLFDENVLKPEYLYLSTQYRPSQEFIDLLNSKLEVPLDKEVTPYVMGSALGEEKSFILRGGRGDCQYLLLREITVEKK